MEIDRNGLEVLSRAECLALLPRVAIGRVGLTSGALPTILPVNYHFDGRRILIRSGRGTKLDAALHGNVVAFEVDDFDAPSHRGWSVVVTGVANAIEDPVALKSLATAPLPRWAPLGEETVVAISTAMVSGRRLDPVHTAGAGSSGS